MLSAVHDVVQAGARKKECCRMIGISAKTLENWKNHGTTDRRKGASKKVPRKLSEQERQQILEACNSERFKDMTPNQIVPILAQEGFYYASESTLYRILKEENKLHHRENTKPQRNVSNPPELVATAPNQVWSWDITWLPTAVRGIFLFAYVIIDIYDKSIVGWEIHEREDAALARDLFHRLSTRMNLKGVHLHSDNGSPMKGLSLLALLYMLGVRYSFSRPRVSNDNPFIESFFKTLKYTTGYPGRFRNIDHARNWMADFIDWYNYHHLHSALGYITPNEKRTGKDSELFKRRNATMEAARNSHAERWGKRSVRKWTPSNVVVLNPGKNYEGQSSTEGKKSSQNISKSA
ncbi:IS3 family transposase [Sediminispirochaeta smaragdinae]|uniref:Integrase catalytic region n=1 Tax=Sediminispirochaeta smaragdinae (strain DSM 11293 / JCM 15392 / SEBR 4228) TaxID=573413 RepID=E1R9F4_SEDSS|nr:IS3 family transposase [Sediminispirochaeta smaragdinae]ADK79829.1 Integrase catalytic region [Sediminispirochaeta smaragdinae DSM 11293]ADK83123.1 Integrase catalytic region [Sediminispirochaeta smaragdinae DSM 11293]